MVVAATVVVFDVSFLVASKRLTSVNPLLLLHQLRATKTPHLLIEPQMANMFAQTGTLKGQKSSFPGP
jgi:hypothetical protein